MTLRHVVMDEVIIREGDKGDEMYIVERLVILLLLFSLLLGIL